MRRVASAEKDTQRYLPSLSLPRDPFGVSWTSFQPTLLAAFPMPLSKHVARERTGVVP